MTHDGSIASQVEDWIVTQIAAIQYNQVPLFEESEVQPWNGSDAGSLAQFGNELMEASRDLIARVLFRGDRAQELQEGEIRMLPTYVILIGIRNQRPAAARRGDGTSIGTNGLRDLLRLALHDKLPLDSGGALLVDNDNIATVERTLFQRSDVVFNTQDRSIQESVLLVEESRKA